MSDMTQTPKAGWARRLPLLLILAVAVLGAFVLRDHVTVETLRENHQALVAFRDDNIAVAGVVFILAYVLLVAFSLPGALVATLTGGFLFGTFTGAMLSVTGATIGATVIFLAARHGFGAVLKARMDASEGRIARLSKGIDDNQWSMLFLIRLVPAVPFFVANLLPAFLDVPLHRYVISTFFGIIPGALVYASVGAGLEQVFARGGTPDLGVIFEPHVLLPILGLCLLSVLPAIAKSFLGKGDI